MIARFARFVVVLAVVGLVAGCQEFSWPWPNAWGQKQQPSSPPPEPQAENKAPTPQSPEAQTASHTEHAPPPSGPWVGSGTLLVNGEEITVEEVLDPIRAELERAAETMSPTQYRQEVQQVVGRSIWQAVNEVLVFGDAQKIVNEQVETALKKEIDRIITQRINTEFDGRRARFESYLAELGITESRVRELARRQLLVNEYLRQKFSTAAPEPTRGELYDYYVQHMDDYRQPARAELFLIDIPVEALVKETDEANEASARMEARREARDLADRAKQELDSGMDFAAVARTYSEGMKAAEGGAWGMITAPGLRGRYALPSRRLFELKPGECSDVIDAGDAFFIVKAGQATPAHTTSFEEAQPEIRQTLRANVLRELEADYLAELRAHANVQRWDEFKREVIARIPRPPAEQPGRGESSQW